MSREYSENVLVQNSAGNLLQNVLGWEVVMAYNSEKLGPDGTLGRTSYGEVLLTRYFRQALLRLNPWLTPNQLDEVQKKFTAHVSTASLMQINEEKYFLLRDGIPVTVKRPDGRTEIRSAAVINFKNPENNHFLAVKEMKIHSQLYRRRTDIVGFVNGIPLLFIELKKPTVDVQNAYIYEGLQQKRKHADNTDLMVQINGIVNEYIHVEKPDQEAVPSRQFDISKIDFDLLSREFAHTRRKNLLLRDLDELVNQQLAKMLFANPQRIDYYDRYQEIIDAYNAEQNRATIEKTFMDLMELASSLDTEQQRYVREGFSSDEELSVYDLLFSENLTKQEIETIKKVSVDLLTKIKQQIAKLDHWTDKQETKAIVDNLIRNTLWQELPNSYDVSDIQTYQKKIYEYVYMRYPEVA